MDMDINQRLLDIQLSGMNIPRRGIPPRTGTPSQTFAYASPNPNLELTPDVRKNHRYEREDSEDEIFSRPRHYSTLEVENGTINIRVPCVYNGPLEKTDHRRRKSAPQVQKERESVAPSRNRIPLRQKPAKTDPPPFISAVRSSTHHIPSLGQEKRPSSTSSNSKVSKIEGKMVWNFEGGKKVSFLAVDYGQELFEQAAATFAAKEAERKAFVRGERAKSQSSISSKTSVKSDDGPPCHDYSRPRYNTSRHSAKALHKALADLNNLPMEIEKMVREDKRFENVVMEQATRHLNMRPSKQVYSNLLSVQSDPSHISKIESKLLGEMKLMQPTSRPKDSEPQIEDYNELKYNRIKPRLIPLPPKSLSGVSVKMDQDFHLIKSEHKFADESERMV